MVKQNNIKLVTSQCLRSISDDEWATIRGQRLSYTINDSPSIVLIKWPGTVFSSKKAQQFYTSNLYSDILNVPTPPRGNLSTHCRYIFIGIRPGHTHAHLSKHDTSWMFGNSSTVLHKALVSLGIYPYFTNIYKDSTHDFDGDLSGITKELEVVFNMYRKIYKVSIPTVVLMGEYTEYDRLEKFLSIQGDVNSKRIWHPSYIARSLSDDRMNKWKQQISV